MKLTQVQTYLAISFAGVWGTVLLAVMADFTRRHPWILLLGAGLGVAAVAVEALTEGPTIVDSPPSLDSDYMPETCGVCRKLGHACGSDHQ